MARLRYRLLDALLALWSPIATLRRIRENARVAREIARLEREAFELVGTDDKDGRVYRLYKLKP